MSNVDFGELCSTRLCLMARLKRLLVWALRPSFLGFSGSGRCRRRLTAVLGGREVRQAVGNGRGVWWERMEAAMGMECEDSES